VCLTAVRNTGASETLAPVKAEAPTLPDV